MIDLHSHILDGVDDGPGTVEESLALAEAYVKAGFSGVVATPHWIPGTAFVPDTEKIRKKVNNLNALLIERHIGLTIYPGMEIALDGGLHMLFDQGRLLCLADQKYLLIETPFQKLPVDWAQMISAIRSRGFHILLAHPERCIQLGKNPDLIEEIIDAGVFMQVNYDSFLGNHGSAVSETAHYLLEKGFIHCLATDSHNTTHRHPGNVAEAIAVIERVVGKEQADLLTLLNPGRVIEGLCLEKPQAVESNRKRKRRWFCF